MKNAVALPMKGKRVLVTGSTDGIGRHTATRLVEEGATVLLHGRSMDRLTRTRDEILKQTNTADASRIELYCHDLSAISGAKALVEDILSKTTKLDVLVNNAGVYQPKFVKRPHLIEGKMEELEDTFVVNVAAPYILFCLLLPLLQAAAGSKILNVSSMSQGGRIEMDNLQFQKEGSYSSHRAYSASKLLIAALSHELALKLDPVADALVMSCDPGTVNTKMLLAGWGYCGIEVGDADDQFSLITRPGRNNAHGKYYVYQRESRCTTDVYDHDKRQELWAEMERLTRVVLPTASELDVRADLLAIK